ncbi:MFS transporter [Kitasatospora acidiphila]|uniref:MFS transporter n=1 Tax=Kitasatospora acidiphila TaxID=2567942 RepID=A0A540W661_9ACTN|nr:MFS transporter [Kitasatospora acidiphila]TQF04511.1 MFS transporter [Kitasatospora acidiphila]
MVNVHDSVLPLRSNRRFQLLWTGSAAASIAARLADTAYPLLLLQLTGSPTAAGAFGAVGLGATLLCGLHGGAVADRRDRRRVLLAADAMRFLTAASLAVALIAHQLTLPHALVAAAVTGAAAAYGGPVRTLAIRAVVPPAQLGQALARDELRGSTAALLGPPLAGLLLAAGQALPAMAIAFGSLLAVLATFLVRFDGRRVTVGAEGEGEEEREVGGVDFPGSSGGPTACAGRIGDQAGHREGGREVGDADVRRDPAPAGSRSEQLGQQGVDREVGATDLLLNKHPGHRGADPKVDPADVPHHPAAGPAETARPGLGLPTARAAHHNKRPGHPNPDRKVDPIDVPRHAAAGPAEPARPTTRDKHPGRPSADRKVTPADFPRHTGPAAGSWVGLRFLLAAPVLRATLGVAIPLNLVGSAMTLAVIVLLRDRGVGGAGTGLTLAGEAVGALAGALLVGRLHRLAGPGRLLLGAAWLCVPLLLAPLLPGGAPTVFLALAAANLAMPALRVMLDVLIFQQVPDELRGRVIAATMTAVMLGIPAGTLGAGLLLARLSPGDTLALLALMLAAALLPATASRALWRAGWPGSGSP